MEGEIAITGMSGRFPESDNIAEFSDNLFNKIDLVTDNNRRWEPDLYGIPKRMGQLNDISKYDSQFFGVNPKQDHVLDPRSIILLELTYESIVDAGYDPDELRGKNIGVFIGSAVDDSDAYFCMDLKNITGYDATGSLRSILTNQVSQAFDFKGPSSLLDSTSSSSAAALCSAVSAMRRGDCEAAIVGGVNLCLRPEITLQYHNLHLLSGDGKCKSFDALGDGFVRSEAVVTLFLQRANVARRKYATVVHIKTNTDGFKEQGITFPSAAVQKLLSAEVYKECELDPLKVTYVETHGTGSPAGDLVEISAIDEVLCTRRKEPLLIGSVKSNMGHAEAASGICSVVKIIIGMEKAVLPPNLHFSNPNPKMNTLIEGRVKVVTEATPWNGRYAAFSDFDLCGVNVHGVLKCNDIPPELKRKESCTMPQLVLYSGRTEESVRSLFDYLSINEVQREFFSLLHKSAYTSPQKMPFRGYKLFAGGKAFNHIKELKTKTRPIWYCFSGMGAQWPGMAEQLMEIDVFARSLRQSADVLKPYSIDLMEVVTNGMEEVSKTGQTIPEFISITAVQIALVDVLHELGLKPDGIVGHSVGEIACAYADGSLSAAETVLAAYCGRKAIEGSNLPEGSMAAIGLSWSEALIRCPKDVYPSCHNSACNVTISGPKDSVKEFVNTLKNENIFAREVNSCGYAFHTEYVTPCAEKHQGLLEKVIPNPKPRSSRWISSSYHEDQWNDPKTQFADASYFTHNLVSPVLFHEALRHVPKNAIVIEIAPHHLLQTILKRVVGSDAEYVGLMERNADNIEYLLISIGKLYNVGLNPDIEKLYPPVQFPVPKGTPMISPLIKWNHSEQGRI